MSTERKRVSRAINDTNVSCMVGTGSDIAYRKQVIDMDCDFRLL